MDITLHYTERGAGEPLLLLHGNGEDGGYFAQQLDFFSASRRVLAPDTRGHGLSPRGDAPFTLAQFAADLEGFLDARGLARADVLGFSDGGNIALLLALRRPERLRRLILCGANLDPCGVKRRYRKPIELAYALSRAQRAHSAEARRRAELLGLMVNEPHIAPESLAAIRAPTLVLAGTRDMIREEHTRLIAASIPGAQLAILPGTHFIARDEPEAFNRTVEDFLRRTE